jgi:hypothetical protein
MSGSLAGPLLTALTKMSNNGHSPTAQTFDEITIDINRVTRREFNEFWKLVTQAGDGSEDDLTGDFVEKVVTHWPFEQSINRAGYLALGVLDMQRVDDALLQAISIVIKKKSSLLLTLPENSNGASAQSLTLAPTSLELQNTNMSG